MYNVYIDVNKRQAPYIYKYFMKKGNGIGSIYIYYKESQFVYTFNGNNLCDGLMYC